MAKEKISLDFRQREKIDETRNYLLEEIKHNNLMSEKHKKACRALNWFEHLLIFISAVSCCVSISAFASLAGVLVGIKSSERGLKIYAITARIKKYKSIIKKKLKKQDKIALLAKTKLNTVEVLMSKSFINSYINYDEYVSVNVWREDN